MKVTLAIVLSLLMVDGVGAAIAEYNFRESETQHVRDESASRVDAVAHVLEQRFSTLGLAVTDAAQGVNERPQEQVQAQLLRAGILTDVVLDGHDNIRWTDGRASDNATLRDLMLSLKPPVDFPGRAYTMKDGWLVLAVRAVSRNAIIGAIDEDTLSSSFLNDVLIDSGSSNAVVTRDGALVAASLAFNATSKDDLQTLAAPTVSTLDGGAYIVERRNLSEIQGYVAHVVPASAVESRVTALAYRFVATSTAAVVLAGLATVFIVTTAMRPLRKITDAARRLGRGDAELHLDVGRRDELGALADVLNQSAAAIGDARKQQEMHADELRLAAEDFQVAVGALARSVGEADTGPEVAKRLADAALLVAPSRAVAIFIGHALLETRIRLDERELDDTSARAMLASDPDAFTWFAMRSQDEDLRLAVLPQAELREGDGRKIEILLNQAALAFHRAKATDGLRRAHQELDELFRQKQVYMDILSHDLKNPLAVARGRVEMVSMKHPDIAEKLSPVEQSLDRATKIIEEAVLFSKLEREKELDRPVVDLASLAQDAVHGLAPLAVQKGIDVLCSAPASVPWNANHLLVRAIENLLSNAIKWSPEGSNVAVVVDPEERACFVRIVDHGPGIPLEDRARLFGRFERADRSGVKGTGLGLAIAKRVVDMHGGAIHIEDTPGGGCTFVIELPAAGASAKTSGSVPPEARSS